MWKLYLDTIFTGFILGVAFALGVGLIIKIDAFFDYHKHGN